MCKNYTSRTAESNFKWRKKPLFFKQIIEIITPSDKNLRTGKESLSNIPNLLSFPQTQGKPVTFDFKLARFAMKIMYTCTCL